MSRSESVAVLLTFFLLNIVLDLWGDTNPRSRLALLSAISEGQGFSIDGYQSWTIDWARTPDGRHYSNKAPGPVFLALPVYWLMDKWVTRNALTREERDVQRLESSDGVSQVLSLLFQAIPFGLLFLWGLAILRKEGAGRASEIFFAFAFLFGTTVTLLMNTYFGHAIAAVFAVALLFSVLEKRWFLSGTFLGWGLISDYGSALLLPGILFILLKDKDIAPSNRLVRFLAGGIVPGTLWIYYHWTCFGGPFVLPNRFQNPAFVESSNAAALWGIFGSYPKPEVVYELLLGPSRGILFTQPWILVVLVLLPILYRHGTELLRRTSVFCGLGFGLMLLMNASFLNWHSGGGPGPRYLCAVLPLFAFLGAFLWESSSRSRAPLLVALVFTLAFESLVFASHRIQNPESGSIWVFFSQQVFGAGARMPLVRFVAYWALLGGLIAYLYRAGERHRGWEKTGFVVTGLISKFS